MEGTKYQLIIIFLVLNIFFFKVNRAFTVPIDGNSNSVFRARALAIHSGSHFKHQIYQAYITGKMEDWKTTVDIMEEQKKTEYGFLLELISYQYGYIGWCLGNDRKPETEKYLSLLEENLKKLKKSAGETAEYHAYTAAAYGFNIGLSSWRAPFFGPRSMGHAEKALEADSLNFQANMEMGNIWNHMPAVFGGSGEKALKYYMKALKIIEKEPEKVRKNNWMYLNLLTLVGRLQQETGNLQQAKKYFEQALQIEPNFVWVKEELLPSL
jgi:tetratricopeptide (TPR) repeat protein